MLQFNVDVEDAIKKTKVLNRVPNGSKIALCRSLNKGLDKMNTEVIKGIKKNYHIKSGDYTKTLRKNRASYGKLEAYLYNYGRPIRGVKFKFKRNTVLRKSYQDKKHSRYNTSLDRAVTAGKGVFLNAKKSESGNELVGNSEQSKAFVTKMQNGMEGIFVRTGKMMTNKSSKKGKNQSKYYRRNGTNKGRENIKQIYGPGSSQMMNNENIRNQALKSSTEVFNKELDRQINLLLKDN